MSDSDCIGAFRFTGKQKHELLIESRFLLAGNKFYKTQLVLFQEPQKTYQFYVIHRDPFEDAFDEIEILGFCVSFGVFDLLQNKYRGKARAKDPIKYYKEQVRILAFLISRKQVPTKRGIMYFGIWIDRRRRTIF